MAKRNWEESPAVLLRLSGRDGVRLVDHLHGEAGPWIEEVIGKLNAAGASFHLTHPQTVS